MEEQTQNENAGMISKLWEDSRRLWGSFPRGIQFLMVLIVIAAVSGAVFLSAMDFTEMRTLYSDLSASDASEIATKLAEKKVAYKVSADGSTITVPQEQVDELRLEMAGAGLPSGGGVGFELFDEQRLGMTDFEERVSLTRALEGELARTIGRIDAVKNARVHLVLTKKSLFGSQASPSTGSVVLEMRSGGEIPGETMGAIVHLVSSAVEGLSPENVTVVDTRGRLLASGGSTGLRSGGNDIQQKYSKDLEVRVKEMLNQIVGTEGSVVRVSAEFDFQTEEVSEESYDPDKTVLRSEQRELETSGSGVATAAGVPGSRSNLPGGELPGGGQNGSNFKREKETKNYEMNRVVRKVLKPGAQLSRVSVAVLVDGLNEPGKAFEPRTPKDLQQIEQAVKGAIGFNEKRGDKVVVESVPFVIPESLPESDVPTAPVWKNYVPLIAGGAVFLFLALFFLGMRKRKGAAQTQIDSLSFPRPVGELQEMMRQPQGAYPQSPALTGQINQGLNPANHAALVGEVRELFLNESEGASRVLKNWLREAAASSDAHDHAREKA